MKARPEDIENLASEVANALIEAGIISPQEAPKILGRVHHVFSEEQQLEDELDRQVQKLMQEHMGTMGRQGVDRQSVHSRIRKKLAEDMGLVI